MTSQDSTSHRDVWPSTSAMSWRGEVGATAQLAWPIILGNISHILLSLIDNLMIGRLGREALAAVAFGGAIFGFCIITSVGFTAVISPLVAHEKGAGRARICGEILYQGLVSSVFLGLLICAAIYLALWQVEIFRQPLEVQALAVEYLTILAPSLLLVMVMNTFQQFAQGLSYVRPFLVFLFASLVLNVFFNWLLIFGHWGWPRLGVEGAAWGTVAARGIVFVALWCYVFRHRFFRPYLGAWRGLNRAWQRRLWRLGGPSSVQYASEAGAFAGAAILMGWVGTVELAAHQIAINLASMTFMVALGVSSAAAVRVGQAMGAGQPRRARWAGFSALLCTLLVMGLTGLAFAVLREWLPTFYIEDRAVVEMAAVLLIVAAAFQVFDGAQAVAIGALRGLLDVRWPTGIAVFCYWGVSLPLGYTLALRWGYGGPGVWAGMALALALASLALSWRFHRLSRRKILACGDKGDDQ